jgi:DNA-binding response OmpR family regulator
MNFTSLEEAWQLSNNSIDENSKRRILLVDDEQDITFAISIGLENNGFVVDTFNDPLLALQSFKDGKNNDRESYDLALLDIKMPKMNGYELYNEIRKIDDKVKICFITAFDIQKDEHFDSIVKSTDKDKPVVIRKPIDIEELVKRIKEIIPTSI